MEHLPGCAQWVCVAMSSCGACFPLLLPGSLDLQQLLGCCLLLLGPACSGAALSANWEGQESRQVTSLLMLRVADAASIITAPSSSSSSSGPIDPTQLPLKRQVQWGCLAILRMPSSSAGIHPQPYLCHHHWITNS
ncbi:hypothetical protein OEZ85_004763 [Tetradesmus obliquus]|uniref:Uncharacterized protein n=1 Tax=Tetradesmus obliquus TaxID=3088 RepID=A0ABY8ULX8_TETOB|nr:hypothetical protein OEZ85_004763 [Tetradesmus obliquus]